MITARAGALAAVGAAALHAGPLAGRLISERALARRCARQRVLALTYDDGPSARLTPRVLDMLGAHGATATFFLVGSRTPAVPAVVDRIRAEGHEVACHGYAHLNALKAGPWRGMRDIEHGYRSLARWTAEDAPFRPPFGKLTGAGWLALRRRGAPAAWWTTDSGDTHEGPHDHDRVDRVVRTVDAAGGGVVLLHDHDRRAEEHERQEFVVALTDALLTHAAQRGWAVRPIGTLL